MQIHHANLETCHTANGTVVVIDVIRAFTTAAFAFAAGVRDIVPVGTVEEALSLRNQASDTLVMGEVGGFPPDGFDYGNSPSALKGANLQGHRLIQRTSSGTQGIVRSVKADTLLAGSFVCAGATVEYIRRQSPDHVTLVSTGKDGEDQACASYIEALLRDEVPDTAALLKLTFDEGHRRLNEALKNGRGTQAQAKQFAADLDCCIALDQFAFVMQVHRQGDLLVLTHSSV